MQTDGQTVTQTKVKFQKELLKRDVIRPGQTYKHTYIQTKIYMHQTCVGQKSTSLNIAGTLSKSSQAILVLKS